MDAIRTGESGLSDAGDQCSASCPARHAGRVLTSGRQLPVAGLTPLTTVDWPERLAATIFTRGCPWACPYCHNQDLQAVDGQTYDWERVLDFLGSRRGLLDGVVVTGGEPCLHASLPDALAEIRALGFGTALHTGGAFPDRLADILDAGLVDWVGLDFKAPFDEYPLVTGKAGSGERARRSLELLVESGADFEVRTTVWTALLTPERMGAMARQIEAAGRPRWVWQPCLSEAQGAQSQRAGLLDLADRLPTFGPVEVRA